MFNLDLQMNMFRGLSIHLFNNFFDVNGTTDYKTLVEELESFDKVESVIFEELVLRRLGLNPIPYGYVNKNILVKPRTGNYLSDVMINRDVDAGYWDYPLSELTDDTTMYFVEFFDWEQMGAKRNAYVRFVISDSSCSAELRGKHALVESELVRFDTA